MENADKIRKRDDKLLKREKSWRRARIGAGFFAVVCFLILYMTFDEIQGYEGKVSLVGWFLFWVVVLDWLNLRIRHIESIKYYRSSEQDKAAGDN